MLAVQNDAYVVPQVHHLPVTHRVQYTVQRTVQG